jgi:hypothetical protein
MSGYKKYVSRMLNKVYAGHKRFPNDRGTPVIQFFLHDTLQRIYRHRFNRPSDIKLLEIFVSMVHEDIMSGAWDNKEYRSMFRILFGFQNYPFSIKGLDQLIELITNILKQNDFMNDHQAIDWYNRSSNLNKKDISTLDPKGIYQAPWWDILRLNRL